MSSTMDDVITIYSEGAQRLQTVLLSADVSETTVDLPPSVYAPSVVAYLSDSQPAPLKFSKNQVIIQKPSGRVRVQTSTGNFVTGTLESINATELVLQQGVHAVPLGSPSLKGRPPQQRGGHGAARHVVNYRGVEFLERFEEQRVTVAYVFGSVGWTAVHTLLIDPEVEQLVNFSTVATVRNDTGMVFHASSLRIAIGAAHVPVVIQEARMQYKMAGAAPLAARARVSSATQETVKMEERESADVPSLVPEDYKEVIVGPQRIDEQARFDILTLRDLPVRKMYWHTLEDGNTRTTFGWQLSVPRNTVIAPGEVVVYSADATSGEVRTFLGTTYLKEQRDTEELDVVLGSSSVVETETTIQHRTRVPVDKLGKDMDRDEPVGPDTQNVRVHLSEQWIQTRLTNHSGKHSALVVLRYPIQGRAILKSSRKPDRVRGGKWEFCIELRPSQRMLFKCQILTSD